MESNKVYERILEKSPMLYIYGKIVKNNNGIIDLMIMNSNYKEKEIVGKTIIELEKERNHSIIDWITIFNLVMINGGYCSDIFTVNKLSEDELVIWFDERKKYEKKVIKEQIEKHVNLLQTFIDNIPYFVFYKDIKGRYVFCNKELREFAQLKKDEIIGKTDREIKKFKNTWNIFKETDEKVIESGKELVYEHEKFYEHGQRKVMEIIKSPFFDENKKIIGVIGVSQDVTHKKAIEENLKENRRNFQEIWDHLQDAIIIIKENKVLYVNDAYEKIFGLSCKSLLEIKDLSELLHNVYYEDIDRVKELEYNKPFELNIRIIRNDSELRWIWIKASPIKDDNGKTLRTVIGIIDITDQVEESLELDNLRMEFFANLSHEFKTPINLIFSSMQLLKMEICKLKLDNESKFIRYIDISNQNALRLLKLINNLIDSTKISSGYFDYSPKDYNIVEFVEGVCTSVCEFAKQNNVDIIFDTDFEEKIVAFDLDKIERIVLNLLSNAIKFSKDKGKIEIFIKEDNKFISIIVKDNGIGIPKDKLEMVFDRFNRVNSRMTKVCEGSGIGLSLVKALVELHKGKIEVKSALGLGTEFTIKIPNVLCGDREDREKTLNQSFVDRIKVEFSDIYPK